MPSSQADKSLSFLHPNKDGSLSLKYEPREAGVHEVCLNLNDQGFDGGWCGWWVVWVVWVMGSWLGGLGSFLESFWVILEGFERVFW